MKIDFSFDSKYGTFRDAITLDDEILYDPADVEKMKQDRFNSWIKMIETPSEIIVQNTDEMMVEDIVGEQLDG